jgi:hypothetical protein
MDDFLLIQSISHSPSEIDMDDEFQAEENLNAEEYQCKLQLHTFCRGYAAAMLQP